METDPRKDQAYDEEDPPARMCERDVQRGAARVRHVKCAPVSMCIVCRPVGMCVVRFVCSSTGWHVRFVQERLACAFQCFL